MSQNADLTNLRRRTVGRFVRHRRVKAGLTQLQVSSVLGYASAQFVSNWERGISLPPLDSLLKLTQVLEVDPNELFKVFETYENQLAEMNKRYVRQVLKKARSR